MKSIKTVLVFSLLSTVTNVVSFTIINNGKEAVTIKIDTETPRHTETVEALKPGKSAQLFPSGALEIYLLPIGQGSRLLRLATLKRNNIPKDANTVYLTQDDKKKWSIQAIKK